jgi:tRNA-Thr(GGU) m(6)t(6)A37 methyltransferase TsaA
VEAQNAAVLPSRPRQECIKKILAEDSMIKQVYQIFPVGLVHKNDDGAEIEIYQKFSNALLGLDSFSHMIVFYWFHKNDTPQKRNTLQVHPRKNKRNPLTGVFGTHAPLRPNLIAISVCRIRSILSNRILIDEIDALDGSPVIDIKCFIPDKEPLPDLKLPDWVRKVEDGGGT